MRYEVTHGLDTASARFLAIASTMGAELSEADIRETTEIVRQLSDERRCARSGCHRHVDAADEGDGSVGADS